MKKNLTDSKKNRVVVRVPGTSANCGPGFDCLGLATTIYNYLDLTLIRGQKLNVCTSPLTMTLTVKPPNNAGATLSG